MAVKRKEKMRAAAGRSPEVRAWLAREIEEQDNRYNKIVAKMEALTPERERWIQAFLERIQTRGFCVHAGLRRKIKPAELPKRPKGKLRVVY